MTNDIVDVKAALTESLTELHLPTVRRTYEEAARLAERETLSYERYLLDLVTRESQDRQQKRIQRLLRQSRIPAEKALSNFNLKRLPPKVAILTKSLVEGEVLDRRENVLAFGNPGSGKTHLLCAIGQELIARGRRMYFGASGAGSTRCQTRPQAESLYQEAGSLRGFNHRRSRVRATESGRDGSAVHIAGRHGTNVVASSSSSIFA
jgi:DNA replication protein DnaC